MLLRLLTDPFRKHLGFASSLKRKEMALMSIEAPADVFFKRLSKELYQVPSVSEHFHGVEVHEGDFETHGSVKSWSYTIGIYASTTCSLPNR